MVFCCVTLAAEALDICLESGVSARMPYSVYESPLCTLVGTIAVSVPEL